MENNDSRFSLLLLEPYEIFFEDFFVELLDVSGTVESGKLKVCSKSLVFNPKNNYDQPLLRFSYKDCKDINNLKAVDKNQEADVLCISCVQYTEMLEGNVIAPFKFRQQKTLSKFLFVLKYVSIDECLPKIKQLQRAATLPIYEQNSMVN